MLTESHLLMVLFLITIFLIYLLLINRNKSINLKNNISSLHEKKNRLIQEIDELITNFSNLEELTTKLNTQKGLIEDEVAKKTKAKDSISLELITLQEEEKKLALKHSNLVAETEYLLNKKNLLIQGIDELITNFSNLEELTTKLNTQKGLIEDEVTKITHAKDSISLELITLQEEEKKLALKHSNLVVETEHLQKLLKDEELLKNNIQELELRQQNISEMTSSLHIIQSQVDLYSRIDSFIDYGHYEIPQYLYETTERFAIEIKRVREQQKSMIASGQAYKNTARTFRNTSCPVGEKLIARTIESQNVLILRTFNIECDFLIGKVNPGNITRTLERIVGVADNIEKLCADLRFGITNDYVKLKLEECTLQYQFTLKKKEEQEEQRAIREQIREEEKARKEYERQLLEAEKEEDMYQKLLLNAQQALKDASASEREVLNIRILQLEEELKLAHEKSERAKSMAEQTKRGHVYIISNLGSFGENIYKIGLTRRLEPMDRVKELGNASVPFSFDVHAMIASEDAPRMESELHKAFSHKRVNAVNLRKEFFHVTLDEILKAANRLFGYDIDFVTTIAAEEYYQSKRLKEEKQNIV